jgi:outer membrane protein assembly factor BamB
VGAGKELYAISEQTGEQRWMFAAQDFVTSSATVAGGRVFISDFKFVYAVDQQSGQLLWSYPAAGAISFSPVASERVALAMSGEEVVALDAASGRKLWALSIAGEKLIPAAMSAEVAFIKSTETLYAVRLTDGKELWRYHAPNFISLPALAGSHAFVVAGMGADTAVVALDAGSGASVWKQPVRSLATTAPVIAGGALYVRMEDGRVLGLWS